MIFSIGFVAGLVMSATLTAVAIEGPNIGLPTEELRRLFEVVSRIKQEFVDPVEDKQLVNACLRGMASGIDSRSAYFDKSQFQSLQAGQARVAGIGLELSKEGDAFTVIAPIEDSPAYRKGIFSGDLILKIDGADVKSLSLEQVVERLRGKPDSDVTLTIRRQCGGEPFPIVVKRELTQYKSVKSGWIEPGYAYLRLTQFLTDTEPDMRRQLNRLFREGNPDGLVLDLRNNPGGLLLSTSEVATAFLPVNTVIATMHGRTPESNDIWRASQNVFPSWQKKDNQDLPPALKTVPMVVLVNHGTAAGSEILAAALQENKRAIILGEPTFGLNSIQTILPLSYGYSALKLTTARWFTPNGHSIEGTGLTPDVVLDSMHGNTSVTPGIGDSQVRQALSLLKNRPNAMVTTP